MPPDSEGEQADFSMTTVSAQITEQKKARWEQAVNDSDEYSSVSDLIRLAVSREIGDGYVYQSEAFQIGGEEIDFNMDELLGALDSRFEEVNDRIDRLAAASPDHTEEEASLNNRILDLIPTFPSEDEAWQWIHLQTDENGDLENEIVESHEEAGPIAASIRLANLLDEDEHEVREAMYKIEKGSSRFITIREHGVTYLFEIAGDGR